MFSNFLSISHRLWVCVNFPFRVELWKQIKCIIHCQALNLYLWCEVVNIRKGLREFYSLDIVFYNYMHHWPVQGSQGPSQLWQKTKNQTLRKINLISFRHEHISFCCIISWTNIFPLLLTIMDYLVDSYTFLWSLQIKTRL